MKSSLFKQFQLTAKDNGKLIFCFNHYLSVTPLNPKISFIFNAQNKTTVECICRNRANKNISLGIIIISNKPIK